MSEYARAMVWFRRDLRDFDHAALYHALKQARQVVCAFVFDREILDALADPADRRVEFIHASVVELQQALGRRAAAWSSATALRATRSCSWRPGSRPTPCSSTTTTTRPPWRAMAPSRPRCVHAALRFIITRMR